MDYPKMIEIITILQARYNALESRLGPSRTARLAQWMARGCRPIAEILQAWAISVAMEKTTDHDTLVAVHILLRLFSAEARTVDWHSWTDQCIRRLSQDIVRGDLVFRGSDECLSPKWGSRITGAAPCQTRRSARIEWWD